VTKAVTGFRDLEPISQSASGVTTGINVNTYPPDTREGTFDTLNVGVGNYVFKVTEEGMWLGAEKFEDAPFKATMQGEVTIGGYLSSEYLLQGQAASDINTHTTTINGGKITTGSITADKINVSSLSALSANLGIVTSGVANTVILNSATINSTNINGGTINSTTLNSVTINTSTLTGNTISGNTISGGTINGTTVTASTISGNTISGGSISATTITGSTISGNTISGGSISATTITGSTISGNTISGGTVSGTTVSGSTIIIPNESGGSSGYLRWNSGSRIWSDSNGQMGYRAVGGYHYFYGPSGESAARITSKAQSSFYTGIICSGNFNGGANMAVDGYIRTDAYLTVADRIYMGSTSTDYPFLSRRGSTTLVLKGHTDPYYANTYNFGGSTYYWKYVNCYRVSEHSLTSFDNPVEMRDGKKLDDIEALKAIKEDKIIDKVSGRPFLDKRTFPKDLIIPAYDSRTGKPYKRDKNDRPLIPNEKGKLEPRPDADGISTGQMLSLLFGAFKKLVARVETLEKQSKKNVKI